MALTLTDHDLTLEPFTDKAREELVDDTMEDGTFDPEYVQEQLEKQGEPFARRLWEAQKQFLFAHRAEDKSFVPAFSTGTVTKNDTDFTVAKRTTFGNSNRPVLKRHPWFTRMGHNVGKALCVQYAIDTDDDPAEIAREIPFDMFPTEIWRVRDYVDEHGPVWVDFSDTPSKDRIPVSASRSLQGMMYLMYRGDGQGRIIPKYIGISRKLGGDGGLNWNLANITKDSVFGRWGYGSSQHIGEMSRVLFPDGYKSDPEPKYEAWVDDLFVDRSRVLQYDNVYVEMIPWFDQGLLRAEENLIRVASTLFGDELLNTVHADGDRFGDSVQAELNV